MKAAVLLLLVAASYALRLPDETAAGAAAKDALVIVRTHAPAQGMRQRIQELARDVEENLPSAHMVVSVDDSHLTQKERWAVPLSAEHVHRFVWADVQRRFPQAAKASERHRQKNATTLADGKTFHVEPILLALDWARARVRLRPDAFVWVVEDDVFFCGSFSEIAGAYSRDHADFLTGKIAGVGKWGHRGFATEAFLRRYPEGSRRMALEFVERFSLRFLEHLKRLSGLEAVSAQSEMFAPTVCRQDGFSESRFSPRHVGLWHWYTRVGPGYAARFCKGGTTMNHAAKFSREKGD